MDLDRFVNGDTTYISKHNSNASKIETAVNKNSQDIEALKTNLNAGSDMDYRSNNVNVLRNGSLMFWKENIPVGWELQTGNVFKEIADSFINQNSIKLNGELFQASLNHFNLTQKHITFGCYVKTTIADSAQLLIYQNAVEYTSVPTYHSGNNTWEYMHVQLYFSDFLTSPLKFVLKSSDEAFFSGPFLVYGNPVAGGKSVFHNYALEDISSKLTYENGFFSIASKGILFTAGVYAYSYRVNFQVDKLKVPTITIDLNDTGDTYTYAIVNLTIKGFDLLLFSNTEDFSLESVLWEAFVSETQLM